MSVPIKVMEVWTKMPNTDLPTVLGLRETLRLKRKGAVEKLADLDKELEATELVIKLLGHRDDDIEEVLPVTHRELHGMTQLDAMVHIAEKNGNRIKIKIATRLLSAAGLLGGSRKNWYNMLANVIKRSERFEHVGPGEFELLQDQGSVVLMRKAPVA